TGSDGEKKRPHQSRRGQGGSSCVAGRAGEPSLNSIVGKCEGATGSLAIVAPHRGPSHPRSTVRGSRLPTISRGELRIDVTHYSRPGISPAVASRCSLVKLAIAVAPERVGPSVPIAD